MTPETPEVTLVVITRDRWPDLRVSLRHHRVPVLLVDNGSSDGTPTLVRRHFPDVEVVELGANRGALARDVGVARAHTPYVAFADDDSWWAPGSLARAAEVMAAHPRLGLLAARVLLGQQERPDWICGAMADSPLPPAPDLPGPSVLGFVACGAVVRRTAFLGSGGFDEVVFFGGEEERLALDLAVAGWGLAYVDDVVAHHHPSRARDPAARRVRGRRNQLLTAVMRRPWPVVATAGWHALRTGREGRRAVLHALPAVPRALRSRRRLPAEVEHQRRLLDAGGPRAAVTETSGSVH